MKWLEKTKGKPTIVSNVNNSSLLLPDDIVFLFFLNIENLTPAILCQLSLVSKQFKKIADKNFFWKNFFKENIDLSQYSSVPLKEIFIKNPGLAIEKYSFFNKGYKSTLISRLLSTFKEIENEWIGRDQLSIHDYFTEKAKQFLKKNNFASLNDLVVILHSLISIFDTLDNRPTNSSLNTIKKISFPFYNLLQNLIKKHGEKTAMLANPDCFEKINNFFSNTKSDYKVELLFDALNDERLADNQNLSSYLDIIFQYINSLAPINPTQTNVSTMIIDKVLMHEIPRLQ